MKSLKYLWKSLWRDVNQLELACILYEKGWKYVWNKGEAAKGYRNEGTEISPILDIRGATTKQ